MSIFDYNQNHCGFFHENIYTYSEFDLSLVALEL